MNALRRSILSTSTLLLPLLVAAVLSAGCDCVPFRFRTQALRAREAVLRTNLRTLRDVLGQYRGDKGQGPDSLQALVEAGYLRKIPIDPLTKRDDTWIPVYAPASKSVVGVHSGSSRRGSDGRSYSEW
ncbi:MAG: ral secretion pathway protein [Acidobacteriota bacterium]|jgi:general secretion pathway protein G|nr:ral secretion pathway protein [Acidobacteriota bacterium]